MFINRKSVMAALCLGIVSCLCAEITTNVDFSTDDGKNWSNDFPILKASNPKCKVRVKWKVDNPTNASVVTSKLFSRENDFASAASGKQGWMKGTAWFQIPKPPGDYYGPNSTKPFVFDIDLGKREKGVIGFVNLWNHEKKRHVNGPLPEASALKPGTYKFSIITEYTDHRSKKNYGSLETFNIMIEK